MNLFDDHERYARKNAMLAQGYEIKKSDDLLEKKGVSHLKQGEAACFNCKFKGKCRTFDAKRTGGSTGSVSFGGEEKFICEKYEIQKSKNASSMSDKQIKALLKNAIKGRI